jgi:imidazolonepropionase-like amidohydrolase
VANREGVEEMPTETSMKAIVGGTLIDGTGADPVAEAIVLIEGSKITAVGRGIPIPAGSEVIDATNKTVMPGLIDSHMHNMGLREHPKIDRAFRPRELALIRSIGECRALLGAGYTTLRDCGGPNGIYLRDAAAEGSLTGLPRIVAAGLLLVQTTNSIDDPMLPRECADARTTRHRVPQGAESLVCDGVDECVKGTRYALGFGADFIKTFVSGNYLAPNESSSDLHFHMDEIRAIVETAAHRGTFVTAHSYNPISSKRAILGGIKTIDHAHGTDDEVVALAMERGVIFVSSLAVMKLVLDKGDDVPSWLAQRARREWDAATDGYRKMLKAGATLAAGSDYNGSPMAPLGNNAVELELLTKHCGFSPMEAIKAATRNGAMACFLGDKTGTIEQGKFADIIIVDGDPLSGIAILQNRESIKMVMLEGKIEVDRGLDRSNT